MGTALGVGHVAVPSQALAERVVHRRGGQEARSAAPQVPRQHAWSEDGESRPSASRLPSGACLVRREQVPLAKNMASTPGRLSWWPGLD